MNSLRRSSDSESIKVVSEGCNITFDLRLNMACMDGGHSIFNVFLFDTKVYSGFFTESLSFWRAEDTGRIVVSIDDGDSKEIPVYDGNRFKISRNAVTIRRSDDGFEVSEILSEADGGRTVKQHHIKDGGHFQKSDFRFEFSSIPNMASIQFLSDDIFLSDIEQPKLFELTGVLADSGEIVSLTVSCDGIDRSLVDILHSKGYSIDLSDMKPGKHIISVIATLNGGPNGSLKVSGSHTVEVHPLNEMLIVEIPRSIHRWVGCLIDDADLISRIRSKGLGDGLPGYPDVRDPEHTEKFMDNIRRIFDLVTDLGIRPNESLSDTGRQHIRGFEEMLTDGGNCLEISCLIAACMIECGLSPVIALTPSSGYGHATVGVIVDSGTVGRIRCEVPEAKRLHVCHGDSVSEMSVVLLESTCALEHGNGLDDAIESVKIRPEDLAYIRYFGTANAIGINLGIKPTIHKLVTPLKLDDVPESQS